MPSQPTGGSEISVISFEAHKAQKFIERGLLLSYGDPPDSDYQRGFEAGLASIYAECLNGPADDDRIALVLERAGFLKAK